MRPFLAIVLFVCLARAEEGESRIDAPEAIRLAERFVRDKGLLEPPVEVKKGDPEYRFYQGKVEGKAWGYQTIHGGTTSECWRILFPITVHPIPKVKGNETGWGMLVELDPFGRNPVVSHGVAVAFDGKPFEGYIPLAK